MAPPFNKPAFEARVHGLVSYAYCTAQVKPEYADAVRQVLFAQPRSRDQLDAHVRLMQLALSGYCSDRDACLNPMRVELQNTGRMSWKSYVRMMYSASEICFAPGQEALQNGIYLAFCRAEVLDKYEDFEAALHAVDDEEAWEANHGRVPTEMKLTDNVSVAKRPCPAADSQSGKRSRV